MKDFLFAKVADIWAETPKSAGERQTEGVREEFSGSFLNEKPPSHSYKVFLLPSLT